MILGKNVMQIAVIGINHKCAQLSLRERVAKSLNTKFSFPHVILSTCNRSEVYFNTEDLASTHSELLGLLKEEIPEEFEHKLYAYFGSDCFVHLAKVTAGLDSAILGETEIQGQVKVSYERACLTKTASLELHFLFQKALQLAKHVRSTMMPSASTALEEAILQLTNPFLPGNILFVGLSEINKRLMHTLKKHALISVSNRSENKAISYTQEEGLLYAPWGDFRDFDVLIFGTSAGHILFGEKEFARSKAKLILDLSVPRNVDPCLEKHLSLVNIDQINKVIKTNPFSLYPREAFVLAESLRYIEAFRRRREAKVHFESETLAS